MSVELESRPDTRLGLRDWAMGVAQARFESVASVYLPLQPDDDDALASSFEGEGSLTGSPLGLLPSEILGEIACHLDLVSLCAFSLWLPLCSQIPSSHGLVLRREETLPSFPLWLS